MADAVQETEAFFATLCPKCETPIGDHTVRLWAEHQRFNVPFTEVPDGEMAMQILAPLSDTVDVRAMTASNPIVGPLGAVEFHFQIAHVVAPNETIAKVVFVGPPRVLRHAGQLMHAACDRSAAVAEGVS